MIGTVTDLGDPALVLTLLAVVAVVAALDGWWRGAAIWLGVTGSTLAAVLLLKLGFLTGWVASGSPAVGSTLLRSPSGHTACATLAYGGLAVLLGAPRPLWLGVAVVAGVGVGFTRVALTAHTEAEAALGALVGLGGVLLLARWAGPVPGWTGRAAVGSAVAVAIAVLHGRHLGIEDLLVSVAEGLAGALAAVGAPRT